MTRTGSEIEQAVARTLRDSLVKLQHSTEELNHAVTDLVSACSSARPANSLPPMLRAQTAAASLAASLEVLARFVTAALQPDQRSAAEHEAIAATLSPELAPANVVPAAGSDPSAPAPVISEAAMKSQPTEAPEELRASDMEEEGSPVMTRPVAPASDSPSGSQVSPEPPVISLRSSWSQPSQPPEEQSASEMLEEGSPAAPESFETYESRGEVAPAAGVSAPEPPAVFASPLAPGRVPSQVNESPSPAEAYGSPAAPAADPASSMPPDIPAAFPDTSLGAEMSAQPDAESVVEAEESAPTVLASAPLVPGAAHTGQRPAMQVFDISALSIEMQELHKRANRVAKVSMQDIRMLRPNDVKLGKEHKDICHRLRDDIERAHKEYDRRFQTILGHPVDYFYDWMVQILADGDAEALGEYPYPSPVLRH